VLGNARAIIALFGATVILGALVGTASAGKLSSSNRNIRATWATMKFELFETSRLVTCPVTLEGSLHAGTIAKVAASLIGHISRAALDPGGCNGGIATLLQATLPWHVRYQGFTGTLPNITSIRTHVVGLSLSIPEVFGINSCLVTATATQPLFIIFHRNVTTRALGSADIGGLIESTCPDGVAFYGGSSALTLLGATTAITVTLI